MTPTIDTLAELITRDYDDNRRRSRASLMHCRLPHILRYFPHARATSITPQRIKSYIRHRRNQGAAPATVNRELAAMRRMFRLAAADGLIDAHRIPQFSLLREDNVRQGFCTRRDFDAVCAWLPAHLRDAVAFLYLSSWRVDEMRGLTWREVILDSATAITIHLDPARSKNGRGRTLPLKGELAAIIARRAAARLERCPYVFHRDGHQLRDFRRAWATATARAGLSGLLLHDLRRSAIRNMIRAGVPEKVAMALSGHRTRAVFDRYNIVSTDDLTQAVEKIA